MKTLLVLKVSCCRCLAHTQKTSPYIRTCSELITTTETNKLQINVACDQVQQLEAANWQKGKGMCFRGVLDHCNTTSTSNCTVPTINKNIEGVSRKSDTAWSLLLFQRTLYKVCLKFRDRVQPFYITLPLHRLSCPCWDDYRPNLVLQ